jgi:hypothetical protein
MKSILRVTLVLLALNASAQTYYMQGLLRQPDAATARAYLGIPGGPGGGGSVSNFIADSFSPLFTTSVSSPTSAPHLSFHAISQSQNRVFASPDGSAGNPSFRALVLNDLPDISSIIRGDFSATAPVLYNSTTGVFSMHVADSTHDGYLSSSDWNLFNGNSGNIKDLNGSGTNTSLYGAGIVDLLNFGDTAGSAGSLTFSPGPANSWEDFTLSAGTAPLVHFHVLGDLYFTGTAYGSGAGLSDIPISALSTNGGQNGQIATIGSDGQVHYSNSPPAGVGTLTGVTNASLGLVGVSPIANSNAPVPSFKSFTAGTGMTLSDQGTTIVFNATSSGTVVSLTNASGTAFNSLISNSNAPIPSLKSISAGTGASITDNGGTNLSIAFTGSSGGFTNSPDISLTNLVAYAGGTNFALDFSWAAQSLNATGDIVFNYSTNLPLSTTSRVASVYIPPAQLLRKIFYTGAATNWQTGPRPVSAIPTGYGARFVFQSYGLGDSNVICNATIDGSLSTSNTTASFCPTNIGGVKLWIDASSGLYYDEYLTIPAQDGLKVRGWKDLSGFVSGVTNNAADTQLYFSGPNSAPNNIPSLNVRPGTTWLSSPTFTALPQPLWAFIMFYGRGGDNAQLDGNGASQRLACFCSETTRNICQFYCGGGGNINYTPGPQVSWKLFSFFGNGATSVIRTNGVQAVTGNPGTQSIVAFHVAADYNNAASLSDNYIAEIVVCQSNLTSIQVTNMENYFLTKYGRW